jgi:lipopolysaccharide/colanic/teichoic acid biosynthesis glycosyltransferase
MPDDQFAPQTTLQASFQVSEDYLAVRTAPTHVGQPPGAIDVDPTSLVQRQEALIVRAYQEVEPADSPISDRVYVISKRVLDLLIAIPALIVLSPLMMLIAVAIRVDSDGPALFVQHRVGHGGRLFKMFKFRSMSNGCSMLKGATHKVQNDHRVTRVGHFLRRTSLDELPQLINVVLGQMTLVGPRPELPSIVLQKYEAWQYQRLAVPQGITGWWQVTGRGSKLLWKHTRDDLYYIQHASFLFDLKLIAMTIKAVLKRDGAF